MPSPLSGRNGLYVRVLTSAPRTYSLLRGAEWLYVRVSTRAPRTYSLLGGQKGP